MSRHKSQNDNALHADESSGKIRNDTERQIPMSVRRIIEADLALDAQRDANALPTRESGARLALWVGRSLAFAIGPENGNGDVLEDMEGKPMRRLTPSRWRAILAAARRQADAGAITADTVDQITRLENRIREMVAAGHFDGDDYFPGGMIPPRNERERNGNNEEKGKVEIGEAINGDRETATGENIQRL